jgi:hypothetical protein
MRFYKLAGSEQYVSWDTLHNVAGYSEQATNEITWKSVENWGTSAGTGYELPVELFASSELFMDDVFGWHDLDWFALEQGVYPSTASDMVLTHPTYGSSPVVFMVFDDGTYYLIQKDISQGWMTEEEYTERGWQLPGYIVLNSETGAILGAAKGHELETVPIPACVIASPEMECVPIPARVLESPEMVVYVPTVVELPEVTFANDTSAGNWIMPRSGDTVSINADSVVEGYYWTGSAYQPTTYNSSKVYAAIEWFTSGNTFAGRVEFQFVNYNGTIGIKNNTSGTLVFGQAHLAACHSSDATVVPVYDSSNNAYNAFKYTTNNTDYYYVLDGTQTDWTDDLASIGYHTAQPEPDYLDIFFYYNADGSSVTFAANDYWSTRIRNDSDKAALENFGVPIGTSDYGAQYVVRTAVDSFTFTPIALYSGDGAGDLQADMSNFYCALRGGNPDPTSLYYGVCIWSTSPYRVNTQTWKCRITRINGGN